MGPSHNQSISQSINQSMTVQLVLRIAGVRRALQELGRMTTNRLTAAGGRTGRALRVLTIVG